MSDDDRPGSQGESGNPNSRLLTQRHMGLEQACLLDELAKSLESRKPPNFEDTRAIAVRHSLTYHPPEDPSLRKNEIDKRHLLALQDLIPPWCAARQDPEQQEPALESVMTQHAKSFPCANEALATCPEDDRWVYLMWSFQRFGRDGAMKVTGFGRHKTERLFQRTQVVIEKHLKSKKGRKP
ncbi:MULTISPECIES: hypothetical protein [Catenuloplanes]|uniref:Uncharacterized protein n=1 Tax=Catenuloplanes niger TaxID=587534 RepID=A0AAE3ZWU1_9ACTN|nr:hypothetical protein [Catenuloplanes niger]MDR7327271.1 hypothetical protein [Catenuloplanes niger]